MPLKLHDLARPQLAQYGYGEDCSYLTCVSLAAIDEPL